MRVFLVRFVHHRRHFRHHVGVRSGDVNAFSAAAEKHAPVFAEDGVRLLVSRLRYNVLRSGLRRISVAYSRISLQVCRP